MSLCKIAVSVIRVKDELLAYTKAEDIYVISKVKFWGGKPWNTNTLINFTTTQLATITEKYIHPTVDNRMYAVRFK